VRFYGGKVRVFYGYLGSWHVVLLPFALSMIRNREVLAYVHSGSELVPQTMLAALEAEGLVCEARTRCVTMDRYEEAVATVDLLEAWEASFEPVRRIADGVPEASAAGGAPGPGPAAPTQGAGATRHEPEAPGVQAGVKELPAPGSPSPGPLPLQPPVEVPPPAAASGAQVHRAFRRQQGLSCYACVLVGRSCTGRVVRFGELGVVCHGCKEMGFSYRQCAVPTATLGPNSLRARTRRQTQRKQRQPYVPERPDCHLCGTYGMVLGGRRCAGCGMMVCPKADCRRLAHVNPDTPFYFCCHCLGVPQECGCDEGKGVFLKLLLEAPLPLTPPLNFVHFGASLQPMEVPWPDPTVAPERRWLDIAMGHRRWALDEHRAFRSELLRLRAFLAQEQLTESTRQGILRQWLDKVPWPPRLLARYLSKLQEQQEMRKVPRPDEPLAALLTAMGWPLPLAPQPEPPEVASEPESDAAEPEAAAKEPKPKRAVVAETVDDVPRGRKAGQRAAGKTRVVFKRTCGFPAGGLPCQAEKPRSIPLPPVTTWPKAFCRLGHELLCCVALKRHTCDLCGELLSGRQRDPMLSCTECDYDICGRCAGAQKALILEPKHPPTGKKKRKRPRDQTLEEVIRESNRNGLATPQSAIGVIADASAQEDRPQPDAVRAVLCPGGHSMVNRDTEEDYFCNMCGFERYARSVEADFVAMCGCDECDYDICSRCVENLRGCSAEVVAVPTPDAEADEAEEQRCIEAARRVAAMWPVKYQLRALGKQRLRLGLSPIETGLWERRRE